MNVKHLEIKTCMETSVFTGNELEVITPLKFIYLVISGMCVVPPSLLPPPPPNLQGVALGPPPWRKLDVGRLVSCCITERKE